MSTHSNFVSLKFEFLINCSLCTHMCTHTHMQKAKDGDWTQQLPALNKDLSGLGTYDYNYLLALVFELS